MSESTHETKEVTAEQVCAYCEGVETAVLAAIRQYCGEHPMGFSPAFLATVLGQLAAKSWRKQYEDADIPELMAGLATIGLRGEDSGLANRMIELSLKEPIR